jgi:hypothetical protein
VGDLKLTYVRRDLVADPDLTIFAYTAEAGSRHQETLCLLGSWAATNEARLRGRQRDGMTPPRMGRFASR